MRYIIRRPRPENLDEIRNYVRNLDTALGPAAADLRREIPVAFSPTQRIVFTLTTRKGGNEFQWVCHTIEVVAETEPEFLQLAQRLGVHELSHLAH